MSSLKEKATSGFFWNAFEKFSGHLLNLIITVSLARILNPEDFGLIGMLTIFTVIATTFVDSGMGSGLIQKQNRKEEDYSTVFVFNLITAILLYSILFVSAPHISNFYNEPRLIDLLRVLSLNIIVGSFVAIQRIKLSIELNFKLLAKVNIASNFLSGSIAIFLAWYGIGYWALASQILLSGIFNFVFLLLLRNWKYSLFFSKQSFSNLFTFGSKLLFASLYAQALKNIYNVFIGKNYSSQELGFYTRSITFIELVSGTVNNVIQQVTYPLLASIREDKDKMLSIFKRLIRMSSFIIFPSMVLLSLLAEPIVNLLLTKKWSEIIPLIQWMAFARIFYPASALNLNLLNANGRSDLYLKVDISKLPLTLIALIITIPLGIKAMIIGHVITSFISFFINTYMTGVLFKYGAFKQLKDMLPVILSSLGMAFFVFLGLYFLSGDLIKLIIGLLLGGFSYLSFAYFLKIQEFSELKMVFSKIKLKH